MPDLLLQSEATNELRETTVRLVDASGNGVTGIAGSATVKVCKASGTAFVAAQAGTTLTEITGSVGGLGGMYRLRFDAADADTVGDLKFEISHASIATVYGLVSVKPAIRAVDLGADCVTAAKIATDAIDADALKTDAVDEMKAAITTAVWAGSTSSNRSANSMGELLQALFGALRGNVLIDNVTRSNGLETSARVRVFATSTDLDAATPGAGTDEGAIFKFQVTANDAGAGLFDWWKQKRTL